jgi:RNA polymerase sigma-70 factor (ECF subfamily)
MFDSTNPYALRTEIAGGIRLYYISFTDGESVHRETEVSRPVYVEFLRFVRIERNLRRWDERHIERSELTEATLHKRALYQPKTVEELTFDSLRNEQLRLAIQSLPEIQRRRFVLHHEFGLSYQQIADMEGCSKRAANYSVCLAKEKIKEKLK